MADTANTVYRDFVTDGVPSSGRRKPKKSEIRRLLTGYETIINAFISNGGLIYATKAAMDADLAHSANTSAWVISDPTAANNGIYQKQGASGTGSWTRVEDLPYSFVRLSDVGAGTANAIQLTSSIPTSASVMRVANVFEANTGNVTISENGAAAKSLRTNSGNQVAPGGLVAGGMITYVDDGTNFRLISDQASGAVLAACEAAAADAAASAAEVAAFAEHAVRVDIAQAFSAPQQEQGRSNLGAGSYGHTLFKSDDVIAITQLANGDDVFLITRNTDTDSTGNIFNVRNLADNKSLYLLRTDGKQTVDTTDNWAVNATDRELHDTLLVKKRYGGSAANGYHHAGSAVYAFIGYGIDTPASGTINALTGHLNIYGILPSDPGTRTEVVPVAGAANFAIAAASNGANLYNEFSVGGPYDAKPGYLGAGVFFTKNHFNGNAVDANCDGLYAASFVTTPSESAFGFEAPGRTYRLTGMINLVGFSGVTSVRTGSDPLAESAADYMIIIGGAGSPWLDHDAISKYDNAIGARDYVLRGISAFSRHPSAAAGAPGLAIYPDAGPSVFGMATGSGDARMQVKNTDGQFDSNIILSAGDHATSRRAGIAYGSIITAADPDGDGSTGKFGIFSNSNWQLRIDGNGLINLPVATTTVSVAGTQILKARRTGWAAATGTATRTTFATGSVTLPVLAEHVKALIDDFIDHGLIGA